MENKADLARGGVVPEAVSEALRIDTFASVGANKIHVTKTGINGDVLWGKPYSPEDLRKVLPAMIRVAEKLEECDLLDKNGNVTGHARAGGNLMVRPMSETAAFIQLDDLSEANLDRVRAAAFLTVRTSPCNHQAWIAVPKFASDQGRKDFTRRVKKQVTADSSATGSVRLAGTSNFKAKYIGNFPKVEIIDAVPGRTTTAEALQSLGLVAPEDPAPTVVRFKTARNNKQGSGERNWPDYERCVIAAPRSREGQGPDRSMADFFWCLMAAQRGHAIEDIAARLLEVSSKAQGRARLHDEGYAFITAQNAAAAAERGRKRGRG
jgi:DNA primase RepB-like protein